MLLSLVLFGSRARGDYRPTSDIDLLGVVEGGKITTQPFGEGVTFFCYPAGLLFARSENGDLFLLHLFREGKVIHDTALVFESIRERFQFKSSYRQEIAQASAIIWYLIDRPTLLTSNSMKRRLVWAIRTVLIARAAESRSPVFSSEGLAEFASMPGLKSALDNRLSTPAQAWSDLSVQVVADFGLSRAELAWPERSDAHLGALSTFGGVARATSDELTGKKRAGAVEKPELSPFYI